MPETGAKTTSNGRVFRSAKEFEEAMFPDAVQTRNAECEQEHPSAAGARLAEEALAGLQSKAAVGG